MATLSSMTSAFGGGKFAGGMNICAGGAGKISGASPGASSDVPPAGIVVQVLSDTM